MSRQLILELVGDASKLKKTLDDAQGSSNKFGVGVGKVAGALGGLFAGAKILDFGRDAVSAFTESQQAQSKLELALKNNTATVGVHASAFAKLNSELAKHTLADDDVIAATEAQIATFGASESQIRDLIPTVLDLSAKMGIDAPAAADMLDKAALGSVKALKTLGIEGYTPTGDKANDLANIQGLLDQKVRGAAQAQLDAAGPSAVMKKHMDELQEAVGSYLVPALTSLTEIGVKVIDFFQQHPVVTIMVGVLGGLAAAVWAVNAAQTAWTAITGALTVAQSALNVALSANPIGLIVIGVAALAGALVLAYQHSETFRNIVQGAFNAVRGAIDWAYGRLQDFANLIGSIPSKVSGMVNSIPGAGIAKSIGGAIGGLFAEGGRPPVGVASIIGERGPELFVPDRPGTIIPNGMFSMGSNQITIYAQTNADAYDIADEISWAMKTAGV